MAKELLLRPCAQVAYGATLEELGEVAAAPLALCSCQYAAPRRRSYVRSVQRSSGSLQFLLCIALQELRLAASVAKQIHKNNALGSPSATKG